LATILVDTNILIDNLRGTREAFSALTGARQSGDRLIASVLSKVEILSGMRRSEEAEVRRLFDEIEWIDVDDAIAERAGALAATFRRSHRHIDVTDYVVAATAQLLGAELWTSNVRHFPMFPELAPPYEA
jgi:predicted nucleic acid-binding protein